MPAYNSFNLATQGRNGQPNITTNYYNGIARPNPVGDQLGNQTAVQTRPPASPNLTGTAAPQNNAGARYRNQFFMQPGSGAPNADLPDYIKNQFYQTGGGGYLNEDGTTAQERWAQPGHIWTDSQGRRVALLGDNRQLEGTNDLALNEGFDPDRDTWYDPDLGWVTSADNVNDRPWQATSRRNRNIAAGIIGAAAGYGLYSLAGGAGAAGAVEPSFSNVVAGGSTTAGGAVPAASTTAASNPSLWETIRSGASSLLPSGGPVQLSGPGSTMTGTLIDGATSAGGSMLSNPLVRGGANVIGSVIGAYGERQNQREYDRTINGLVERGDTWGPEGREFAKRKLFELYSDPSSIENTPGYKFARDQGEQGINRAAAGKGYFRSPNMLFDLSQFNQGLAQKTWDSEWNKYAKMAGLDFNPASSAQIGAQGAQQSANMRGNTLDSILAAGGTFIDWLGGMG